MINNLFNNLAFNPYLFSVLLAFTLASVRRSDLLLYPLLLLPVLFDYQYVLAAIIAVQLISQLFARGRVNILSRLFFYYLVLILYPILGELFGWLVQLLAYSFTHRLLDHLAINLVCFIPEQVLPDNGRSRISRYGCRLPRYVIAIYRKRENNLCAIRHSFPGP